MRAVAKKDLESLRAAIIQRHDELSPRLKQVAAFVLENPNDLGFRVRATPTVSASSANGPARPTYARRTSCCTNSRKTTSSRSST
jgi:hypothetical protein